MIIQLDTMTNYTFTTEPYGPKSKKMCPNCGKPKCFTQYINTETGEYIADHVGICDHVQSCGYNYTPKMYFRDNGTMSPTASNKRNPIQPATKPASYIPLETMQASLKAYSRNNFFMFLVSLFGLDRAYKLCDRYKIGTSKHYSGGTVFWQIDIEGKVHAGKIMAYHPTTGKRLKTQNGGSYSNWVHSVLSLPDFNLSQCLFGEHLIRDTNKTIAIAEAEKTAVIASIYFPDMVWIAAGTINGLSADKLKVLKGRKVILYPDLGKGYELWQKIADRYNFGISDILEARATPEQKADGLDLADFLIQITPPTHTFQYKDGSTIELTPEGYPASWDLITI